MFADTENIVHFFFATAPRWCDRWILPQIEVKYMIKTLCYCKEILFVTATYPVKYM